MKASVEVVLAARPYVSEMEVIDARRKSVMYHGISGLLVMQ